MYPQPLSEPSVVEASRGQLSPEDADLCECVPVRDEVVEDELSSPCTNYVSRTGLVSRLAIGEVWTDYGNHRDPIAL